MSSDKGREKRMEFSLSDVEKAVEGSQFDMTFFQDSDDAENIHFSSVVKEVDGDEDGTYLVKIRPPLFFLHGFLSNISRALSGIKNNKILDNEEWLKREVEHLRELYPEMKADYVPHDNAFLMEKIDGEVARNILSSEKVDTGKKRKVITELTEALKLLHDKGIYHGEPNTGNCMIGEDGEVYWIDFETQYDESLSDEEKSARDLEQFILSVLGNFKEEGEIGMDDDEIIEEIFETYGNKEIMGVIKKDPCLPLVGPHRVYQFSCDSLLRFYEAQRSIMNYLDDGRGLDLSEIFEFSS